MIVLIGKTCSGKDTILNKLIGKYGYKKLVTYTTRPMRKGEIDGESYHFISEEEFKNKQNDGFFLESKEYNTVEGIWHYGSAKEDYIKADNNSVVILTPSGLAALKVYIARQKIDVDLTTFYIYANNKTIINRLRNRGDKKEEAERRVQADNIDFEGMTKIADKIYYNNECNTTEEVADCINRYMKNRK